MINIANLLKDAPKGMPLYSPLFGNVELSEVRIGDDMPIRITRGYAVELFDKYGRYYKGFPDAECLLFPSKGHTWQEWTPCVEHQYKVHDWIVSNGQPAIIHELKKDYYLGKYLNGHDFCHKYTDEGKLHLWTIQDAKYGDVLANTAGCILIANDNESCLCYIDKNGEFHSHNNKWFFANFSDNALTPATKEQRELLFHKMKEAGYQWDGDKKELRKIQPHYDIANFYAGMPVLVRDTDKPNERWQYVHFSHYYGRSFYACGCTWDECIPFNDDTKHLLGTTDMPSEEFINW